MKLILIILFFIFVNTNNAYTNSLYDTIFYEVNFVSDNVVDDKKNKITEIKFKSINSIFKKILIKEDFDLIKRDIDENFINVFIKNIIIEDEKIINNNYSAIIKINFDKKLIIEYLRKNNFSYIEYIPPKFLTIIFEDNKISKNLFTLKNSHYNFLYNNKDFKNFYQIPNLDINDRYLINENDIKNINFKKLEKFAEKYNNKNIVIIFVEETKNIINYNIYLYSKKKYIKIKETSINNNEYKIFFANLISDILNVWKNENKIQNIYLNNMSCKINYFNLYELKQIKLILDDILSIKDIELTKIYYQNNYYNINYYGDLELLFKLFKINGLNLNLHNNDCEIYLK